MEIINPLTNCNYWKAQFSEDCNDEKKDEKKDSNDFYYCCEFKSICEKELGYKDSSCVDFKTKIIWKFKGFRSSDCDDYYSKDDIVLSKIDKYAIMLSVVAAVSLLMIMFPICCL